MGLFSRCSHRLCTKTAESKKMAAMAFSNYKRRVSCAGNFAQKQEMENKQFAADENKTVNRKWSCDEDGVHMSTKWLPIPRFLRKNEKLFLKRKLKKNKEELTLFRVRTFSLSGS